MNSTPLLDFEYALARLAPDGRVRDDEDVEALAFLYTRLGESNDLDSANVASGDDSENTVNKVASIVVIDDQLAFAEALGIAVSLTDDLAVVGRAPDAGSGVDQQP